MMNQKLFAMGKRFFLILSFAILPLGKGWAQDPKDTEKEKASEKEVTAVGDKASSWSQTTLEAAVSPKNKEILDKAKPKTVKGEIVDVSCYTQLGKRGEAHIECGAKCVRNGQPAGIVDDEGNLYILIEEQHHPRRDGQVSLREEWAKLMGKTAEVSGMYVESGGYKVLFVKAPESSGSKEKP